RRGTDARKIAEETQAHIKTSGKTIQGFADALAAVFDNHGLDKLSKDLSKAATGPEEVAVREQAVAKMRRLRGFLASSPLAVQYDKNPFDGGTPVAVLRQSLAYGEGRLMALVKNR
ncbi:unnamed protein product, partial [Ectocarpus sp. 12 AP-2014]